MQKTDPSINTLPVSVTLRVLEMARAVLPQLRKLPPHRKGTKMLLVCATLGGHADLQISISKLFLWQRPPNTTPRHFLTEDRLFPLSPCPQ